MENNKQIFVTILIFSIIMSALVGGAAGFWAGNVAPVRGVLMQENLSVNDTASVENVEIISSDEEAVVGAVERVSPAVVSIIVSKDLPIIEKYYTPYDNELFKEFFGDGFEEFFGQGTPQYRQNGTEKTEVGGGTGFLISSDGYIITNKHVVVDAEAEYTVLMNDESKHEARILARDPINDLAILKIEGQDMPFAPLGDSTNLKVGQSVIAIGNALGEFRNTVSTGVISGLARSVVAGGFGVATEQLIGLIQTDASINPGNSGGPLLNLSGQVIGINTAIAQNAENIGFAIPVNEMKNIFDSVKKYGKIIRPWLGVRYLMVNDMMAEENQLNYDYGALVVRGEELTDLAVVPGSPADKAGIVENDIILQVDQEDINSDNPLSRAIGKHQPGDKIRVKIFHKGEEKELDITLEEMDMKYE